MGVNVEQHAPFTDHSSWANGIANGFDSIDRTGNTCRHKQPLFHHILCSVTMFCARVAGWPTLSAEELSWLWQLF